MPRRKKTPIEWTTEEAMKQLFPKPVREELKRIAHEKDESEMKAKGNGDSSQDQSTS